MGSVFLDNVDDYLAPSQACVNPLFTSGRAPGGDDDVKQQQKKDDDDGGKRQGGDNGGSGGGGDGSGGAGAIVKPRRMRVARRRRPQQPAPRPAATSQTQLEGDAGGSDASGPAALAAAAAAEDGGPFATVQPNALAGRKRPTRVRQPISLSYTHDDSPLDEEHTKPTMAPKVKKKATVSVADCLACSGCVTSAEAVMVKSHSIETLRENVCGSKSGGNTNGGGRGGSNDRRVVFTVSPASLADLTRHLYLTSSQSSTSSQSLQLLSPKSQPSRVQLPSEASPRLVLGRLATFLKRECNASLVLDGTVPQELSLIEAAEEFCARYRAGQRQQNLGLQQQQRHQQQQRQRGGPDVEGMDKSTVNDIISDARANGRSIKDDGVPSFPMFTPSIALSATETRYLVQQRSEQAESDDGSAAATTTEGVVVHHRPGRDPRLDDASSSSMPSTVLTPMLSSSCPGFVCYVEKTAPGLVPNLCSVKSPMAVAGALVKHMAGPMGTFGSVSPMSPGASSSGGASSSADGKSGEDLDRGNGGTNEGDDRHVAPGRGRKIYHVAVMPCHDKKLEAGRRDLAWETTDDDDNGNGKSGTAVPDVDLVLTTSELWTMIADAATAAAKSDDDAASSLIRPVTIDSSSSSSNNNNNNNSNDDGSAAASATAANADDAEVRSYFDALPPSPTVDDDAGRISRDGGTATDDEFPMLLSGRTASTGVESGGKGEGRPGGDGSYGTSDSDGDGVRMIGSGAYAEYCFRYAARELFGYVIADDAPLPWKRVTRGGGGGGGGGGNLGPKAAASNGGSSGSISVAPAAVRRRRAGAAGRGTAAGSAAHSDMSEVVLYRHSDGAYSLEATEEAGVAGVTGSGGSMNGSRFRAVLKFATAYGFKNVQLVLMKLGKRAAASATTCTNGGRDEQQGGSSEYYHFIEVMACPSGCLNGGGQIREEGAAAKRREAPAETRERVGRNRSIMEAIGLRAKVQFMSNPSSMVSNMYGGQMRGRDTKEFATPALFPSGPFGDEAKEILHTRFHVVPKLELTTGATAGVALDDTKW